MARAVIGTSGFSYKEWKPFFYPQDLSDKQFLSYYASKLRGVEIDSTFYRMPNPKVLEAWRNAAPEDFRFAIKAPQQITHRQRLTVPSDALVYFLGLLSHLGDRLGTVLFQLPPFFRADLAKLEAFLGALTPGMPVSFEFRHPSWFTSDTYGLLSRHGAALCVNDGEEGTTPLELTARHVYVRLRKDAYTPEERAAWQERFAGWVAQGIDVFAFIKHKDNPRAPLVALEFARSSPPE
jgi:uncharacterized protein YecE (DUF72 family)